MFKHMAMMAPAGLRALLPANQASLRDSPVKRKYLFFHRRSLVFFSRVPSMLLEAIVVAIVSMERGGGKCDKGHAIPGWEAAKDAGVVFY